MKSIKKILTLLIIIILILSPFSIVRAEGSFSVSVSDNSVIVGKTVNLTINTSNAEGKFTITSSNANVVSVGTASIWVTSSEKIVLTAKAVGTATITITPTDVSDTDLNKITGARTVTIKVTEASNNTGTNNNTTTTVKSNDATLKSITIGSKTYSGSSLKNTISYTANADVNSIKISATKNNSKASVSGTGTKTLTAGQTNKFTITVTAEDGTKKTYNVNIIRLAEESQQPNIIENETPNTTEVKLALTSLVITGVDLNTDFNPETYNYIANVKNMKELEIVATANKEGAQVNIEGASDLKEGDNKVKVIAVLGEEKVEYTIDVYNMIEEEVVGVIDEENTPTAETNSFIENVQTWIVGNVDKVILIVLIIILSLIAIRYSILAYKYSKKINELMELTPQENLANIENEKVEQKVKKEENKIGRHF